MGLKEAWDRRYSSSLTEDEIRRSRYNDLAIYNGEVARGIVHTPEWVAKMKLVQEEYTVWLRECRY